MILPAQPQKNIIALHGRQEIAKLGGGLIKIVFGRPKFHKKRRWTSKLGNLEDIEHNSLEGLYGHTYGSVAVIMKRAKKR